MKAILAILFALFWFVLVTSFLGMDALSMAVFGAATALLIQGAFATIAMLYTWFEKKNLDRVRPAKLLYGKPSRKFSLIIPARREKNVIGDTLRAMAKIDYPKSMYEVLVVVRSDDVETIEEVEKVIEEIEKMSNVNLAYRQAGSQKSNVFRLVTFSGYPINKPRALNIGLREAKGEIVAVFDAEDEPHPKILSTVDTVFSHNQVDVVQSAVQLVNISSTWFSALASLEYYFWFKSILPMFSRLGSTPLGGNTVFFRRSILNQVDGWDEEILTEDADVGLRLSVAGFAVTTVYEERLATLEEAPPTLASFIRQRSRWDQGYLQVLFKGEWMKLTQFRQQILTLYLLLQPLIHHFAVLGFVFIPYFALGARVPLWLSLYSFLPMYFFFLQLSLAVVGLSDFARQYRISFSRFLYPGLIASYFPYQLVLSYASLRAFGRLLAGVLVWEKTVHTNVHRLALASLNSKRRAQMLNPKLKSKNL